MNYETFTTICIIVAGVLLLALFHWWVEVYTPRKHMREAVRETNAMFPQHFNCRSAVRAVPPKEPTGAKAWRPWPGQQVILTGSCAELEWTRFLAVNEGGAMRINPPGRGVIYVSREDAKEFFGLIERPGFELTPPDEDGVEG